jgi:crossover junction endodeoxyribonuclease RusA
MRDRSPFDGPLSLHATFWLPKPASAPKRKQVWPIKKRSGDWDKLARAFDAFTGVIWQDDAQVVLAQIRKRWADENEPEGPGVSVTIREYR